MTDHKVLPFRPLAARAASLAPAHWLAIAAAFGVVAMAVMWTRWGGTVEDSLAYFNTARYLRGEIGPEQLRAPFPYRLLVPYLASQLPGDLRNGFASLNWFFMTASALMITISVDRLQMGRTRAILAGLALLVSVPTFWYAPYLLVDPGSICARAAFVLAVVTGQPWLAALAGIAGTAIREENILLLVWLVAMREIRLLPGLGVIALAGAWLLLVRWSLVTGLPSYLWVASYANLVNVFRDTRSLMSMAGAASLVLPLAFYACLRPVTGTAKLRSLILLLALPPLYAALSVRVDGRIIWSLYPMLLPLAASVGMRHTPAAVPDTGSSRRALNKK